MGILQQLVLELKMDPETLTAEEKERDEQLAAKTKALLDKNSRRLSELAQYRKVLDNNYHRLPNTFHTSHLPQSTSHHITTQHQTQTANMGLFLDVLRRDSTNEAYPMHGGARTRGGRLQRCSSGFL